MSQKHSLVPEESLVTLGCINKSIKSRIKEVIIMWYSALVRPRLRPYVQLRASHFKGDVNKSISRERVLRIEKGLSNPRRNLSTVSNSLMGSCGRGSYRFVLCISLRAPRSHGWKL